MPNWYNLNPGDKLTVWDEETEKPRTRKCTVVKEYLLFIVVDYGLYQETIDKRKVRCKETMFWRGWKEE